MRNTSSKYKELIKGVREFCAKIIINYADGSSQTLTELQDFKQLKFVDESSSSSEFEIGAAVIGEALITLNNRTGKFDNKTFYGAHISAYTGILVDEKPELLEMGHYIVDEPVSPGISIALTAYDNMILLDKAYVPGITYPATLAQIAQDACVQCGVILESLQFPRSSYVVATAPTDVTCREVMAAVAQLAGCYVKARPNGRIAITWYADAASNTISTLYSKNVCTDDVTITGITVISGETTAKSGADGYRLAISDNILLEEEKAQETADYLGNKLIGLTFRPLSVSCQSDPSIEAGDRIAVKDEKGDTYQTIVTSTTFAVLEVQKIACSAESPTVNAGQRLSETSKAIVASRKYIDEAVEYERTEREAALEELSRQLAEGSGMYVTAEKQEDGSTIYYTHDKPQLQDSQFVVKYTALAIGMSIDGGKTYPYGLSVSGQAILDRLYLIGLNATYIKTGKLQVCDAKGNILFCADMDTGVVTINSGILKVGKGFINTDGRFRLGPISSRNGRVVDGVYTDQDVYFDRAIFIDYGAELFGNNDSVTHTPYIDFHLGESADNPQTDYTARIEQSSSNVISMYGKRQGDGDTPQSCTLNVAVVNTASDARLKDKVQYLDEETSLEFICKLKPAAYRYTADKDEMYHYGLIYQDVEPIIKSKNCALLGKFLRWEKQPDEENKLVEYGALGYIELISDLIGSVKALTARVQELEGSDKK
jgi:hypothetical protein|nr:MAG TPA: Minor structural protein [Caudoviricetes sp.]